MLGCGKLIFFLGKYLTGALKVSESRMSKDSILQLLTKYCSKPSPPGFEDEVRELVIEDLKELSDEVWVDALGNVIAVKRGRGEGRVMIAAHMDEIGLMIRHITKDGFLRFAPIGGWVDRILPGQRVIIKTLDGRFIRGVVGCKAPHVMKPEETKQVIPISDLFIDVGASSREEAEGMGITPGAVAVIERDVARLGNPDIVTGRGFDDKVGLAVMIEALRALNEHGVDVYAVATVQEEVGLKGARVAAFSITPHLGIALDTTIASDMPGVEEHDYITKIGKGPAIKVMDGRKGTGLITHPAIRDLLIEVAKREGIPYQLEVLTGGTTDASIIQLTKDGVPAGTISVPTRYVHSPVETLNLNDAVNAAKLLKAFLETVSGDWIARNLKRRVK